MVLSLDLSVNSTGYALFDKDGQIVDYGLITTKIEEKGSYLWRYPLKSVRKCQLAAKQVVALIRSYIKDLDHIVIEEINLNTKKNMISFKTLAALQFFIMAELSNDEVQLIDMIKCSEWRSAIKLKKDGDWKASAVKYANNYFGTNFEYSDNDVCDALCQYVGWKIRTKN